MINTVFVIIIILKFAIAIYGDITFLIRKFT